jgi:hypothetical protein
MVELPPAQAKQTMLRLVWGGKGWVELFAKGGKNTGFCEIHLSNANTRLLP